MVQLWGSRCRCTHLCSPGFSLGWSRFASTQPLVPLFDAILLSDHTEMGWYRWERQGWLTDKTWRQYPNLSDLNVFLGDTSL